MQTQTYKIILAVIITAIIAGGGVYFWQGMATTKTQNTEPVIKTTIEENEWNKIAQYNCAQSGGLFKDDKCECPLEEGLGQTQEMMYDKSTGYCQTTAGGPGGELADTANMFIGRGLELDACKKELATYKK
ncbi:MAG TPA: hypothetical protein DEP11_04900 [Candidatus Jacksonbacteria bacterium]|nr:hypothetical protein [Candidatus Jacksonbacteria bacterium]